MQGSAQAAVGRSLLQLQQQRHAKAARTFTCDAKCDTQVSAWECPPLLQLACVLHSTVASKQMGGVREADKRLFFFVHAQVKLLEAIILAINLIVAVLVGTCMLNNLGTPTRFEMPKETTQRE